MSRVVAAVDPRDHADARVAALAGYLDDAGLFPPARLPLPAALAAHARTRVGAYGWLVGRFVCPADLVAELAAAADGGPALRLAVTSGAAGMTFGHGLAAELAAVAEVQRGHPRRVAVESVEVRLPPGDAAGHAGTAARALEQSALPDGTGAFLEPHDSTDPAAVRELVTAVAALRAGRHLPPGVKLRCGGPSPASVPPAAAVAAWLASAAGHGVAGKATAGLHHPRPRFNPEVGAVEHGFLNLLVGAALALDGAAEETVEAAVADGYGEAITLDRGALAWRAERWDAAAVAAARRALLTGQGSCSIDEPVADLAALGVLPAAEGAAS